MDDVHHARFAPGGQAEGPGRIPGQFAGVPHDLAADPKLTPTDVRTAAALLFWARSKSECWPSDRRIAERVGRSRATVQRCLGRLEAAGWIRRDKTDANRTGRLIRLVWRVAGECPPPAPVRQPPTAPVRHKEDVVVKGEAEKKFAGEDPSRLRSQPEPLPTPPQLPVVASPTLPLAVLAPAPARIPATPPASAPQASQGGSRLRSAIPREIMESWLTGDDPALRREAERILRPKPKPPAPPPPQSAVELLARIREQPSFPAQAAELLARDLDDRKSWGGFHAMARRAWEGSIPAEALVEAYKQATGGKARNPGAVFMTVVKREARGGNP